MRIALVNKVFSHHSGGGERYAVDLANALIQQGHELHIFANAVEDLLPGMHIYHVPMPAKPGWLRLLRFNRNAARLLAANREKFDISYAVTSMFPVDVCLLGGGINRYWLHSRLHSPVLEALYPLISWNHWAENWLEEQIFRPQNCRLILANSEMVRRHIIEYGHVAPERVQTLYNAIDDRQFNPGQREKHRDAVRRELQLKDDDLAIIYSSMNWKRKGLATLIRSLAHFDSRRYRIVVIGKGKPAEYIKLAQACGLRPEQLHFYGYTTEQEKLYAAGDVLVFPSQYDAFGNVVFEAMACGTPAITTAQAGAGELVQPGVNGYIMDQFDDDCQLAGFLETLMDDERRTEMGRNAAAAMQSQTFACLARRTADILADVALNMNIAGQTAPQKL